MKPNQKTLRAIIEVQVPINGGLDAIAKELQTVAAHLKIGSKTASSTEGFEGFRLSIKEAVADSEGFPRDCLDIA